MTDTLTGGRALIIELLQGLGATDAATGGGSTRRGTAATFSSA